MNRNPQWYWYHHIKARAKSVKITMVHDERDCVSNHRRLDCLLKSLFRRRSLDQRKHHSSASLAFVTFRNSPHKGPVTRKMLPFDDVIMTIYGMTIPMNLCCRYYSHCHHAFKRRRRGGIGPFQTHQMSLASGGASNDTLFRFWASNVYYHHPVSSGKGTSMCSWEIKFFLTEKWPCHNPYQFRNIFKPSTWLAAALPLNSPLAFFVIRGVEEFNFHCMLPHKEQFTIFVLWNT